MSLEVRHSTEAGTSTFIDRLVTHGGFFHADDVFSTALLELLAIYQSVGADSIYEAAKIRESKGDFVRPAIDVMHDELRHNIIKRASGRELLKNWQLNCLPIPVYRTTTYAKDDECAKVALPGDFVYDVGFGRFDHHQKEPKVHENGRKYCALTLIYEWLVDSNWFSKIFESELKTFRRLLLDPIELGDTTGTNDAMCIMVSSYNRNEEDPDELDINFFDCVTDVMLILNSWLLSLGDRSALHITVNDLASIRANRITGEFFAVLEEQIQPSICSAALPPYIIAMAYPTNRGGWAVRSLDDIVDGKNINRFLYPEKFRGTPDAEIGMEFCHPSGFYGTFRTKERAIDFCNSKYLAKNP